MTPTNQLLSASPHPAAPVNQIGAASSRGSGRGVGGVKKETEMTRLTAEEVELSKRLDRAAQYRREAARRQQVSSVLPNGFKIGQAVCFDYNDRRYEGFVGFSNSHDHVFVVDADGNGVGNMFKDLVAKSITQRRPQ